MGKAQFDWGKAIETIKGIWNPLLAAIAVLILGLIAFNQSQKISSLQDKEADLSLKVERLEERVIKQAEVISANNYTITKFHGGAQSSSSEAEE